MRPLRALAPSKINLGLFVGPPRGDGRHELVSVMQSISLADELTLEPAGASASRGAGDRASGHDRAPGARGAPGHERAPGAPVVDEVVCPGFAELGGPENLAARALAAFRAQSGWSPGRLRLTIVKRVPVAGGMGGGSADAAAALRLAAHASGSQDAELLQRLARALGADVPAQVQPGRWLALGAGELLQRLPPPRQAFGVLVLPLAGSLSTASVYAQADRLGAAREMRELCERGAQLREALAHGEQLPVAELLHNDLQRAAVSLCPEIEAALGQARASGAETALVSGSGPTVLGLFGGGDGPQRARAAARALDGRDPRPFAATSAGTELARVVEVRNNDRPDHRQ